MVADDPAVSGSPRPTLRGSPGRLLKLTRLGEAGPLPIVRGVLVASFSPITNQHSALPALSHCRHSTGLAQTMLDEMACPPSLSPHRLFQRAVGYNFCLAWSV